MVYQELEEPLSQLGEQTGPRQEHERAHQLSQLKAFQWRFSREFRN